MKTFFALLAFAFAAALVHAAKPGHEHAATYQCPMHPWIKSDKPDAKCTICGMALVAATPKGGADEPLDPNLVTLTANQAAVTGVQTAPVVRGPLVRTLRVNGVIDDDETRHRILAARVPGRIEKLHVNYVGAEVRAGEPLVTIYSPEMLTAQRTYVERLRAGTTAFTVSERSAARERLLELGLTAEEIRILEAVMEPTAMVTVRAPMSGTVVSRAVYEGQYVETNDRLFEVGDFSRMWFVFDVYEADLAWVRTGQTVEIGSSSPRPWISSTRTSTKRPAPPAPESCSTIPTAGSFTGRPASPRCGSMPPIGCSCRAARCSNTAAARLSSWTVATTPTPPPASGSGASATPPPRCWAASPRGTRS
jgi:membrane fusion protein, copper/silver efflux system